MATKASATKTRVTKAQVTAHRTKAVNRFDPNAFAAQNRQRNNPQPT